MESGLSTGDLALMERNNGFGGDGMAFMWIFALLILAGGGFGGFGGFGNRGYGEYATAASQQEILFGQQFQGLDNKIDRVNNGICDATFALNNSIKDGNAAVTGTVVNEGRSLQSQLADCCCTTQRAIDAVNYNGAINTASINENTTVQIQKVLDAITCNRMADMQNQINQLQLQNAMCGVIRYPMATTYGAGTSCFSNNCGCGTI